MQAGAVLNDVRVCRISWARLFSAALVCSTLLQATRLFLAGTDFSCVRVSSLRLGYLQQCYSNLFYSRLLLAGAGFNDVRVSTAGYSKLFSGTLNCYGLQ